MPKKHIQSAKTRKRKGKDLDEIVEDLEPSKAVRLAAGRAADPDTDLPGDGQFFCTECDRHFMDNRTLTEHTRTKAHKRRLKMLSEAPPYSVHEAEAAAGVGTYKKDGSMGGKRMIQELETKKKQEKPILAAAAAAAADDNHSSLLLSSSVLSNNENNNNNLSAIDDSRLMLI